MSVRAVPLLLTALALGACGDDSPQTGGRVEAPLEDRQAVEELFETYNQALVERDFDTACDSLAPSTVEQLKENVSRLAEDVETCQQALEAAYESAVGDQEQLLDEIARNAELTDVEIAGDEATLRWKTTRRGDEVNQVQQAEKVAGKWRLVDRRELGG